MLSAQTPRSSGRLRTLLTSLGYLYGLSTAIAVAYFNWQYAREIGFMNWLVSGPTVVSIAKGVVWPYYALRRAHPNVADKGKILKNAKIMLDALDTYNHAFILEELPDRDLNEELRYRRQALALADEADEDTLNRLCPELGTHFKRQFREAMRLWVFDLERGSMDVDKFHRLNVAWADWYNANRQHIQDAINRLSR